MKGSRFSLNSIYEIEWLCDESDNDYNYILKSYKESQEWIDNYNKLMNL